MLVLTRKSKEAIRIGDDIIITVLESFHQRCRLGIEAPREVPIFREELYLSNVLDHAKNILPKPIVKVLIERHRDSVSGTINRFILNRGSKQVELFNSERRGDLSDQDYVNTILREVIIKLLDTLEISYVIQDRENGQK